MVVDATFRVRGLLPQEKRREYLDNFQGIFVRIDVILVKPFPSYVLRVAVCLSNTFFREVKR